MVAAELVSDLIPAALILALLEERHRQIAVVAWDGRERVTKGVEGDGAGKAVPCAPVNNHHAAVQHPDVAAETHPGELSGDAHPEATNRKILPNQRNGAVTVNGAVGKTRENTVIAAVKRKYSDAIAAVAALQDRVRGLCVPATVLQERHTGGGWASKRAAREAICSNAVPSYVEHAVACEELSRRVARSTANLNRLHLRRIVAKDTSADKSWGVAATHTAVLQEGVVASARGAANDRKHLHAVKANICSVEGEWNRHVVESCA
jgi:hypothetical protein